jgi:pimeloyl-ACP methyl ester carboxylesterase
VIERVDLGICPAYDYRGDGPTAVALPGAMFAGMPALWFAYAPLVEAGWRVVHVWDEFVDPARDRKQFTLERAEAAIEHAGGADLLLGKSMGTLAASIDLPGVWLTPLLRHDPFVADLRRRTAPSLLVGGTKDPAWDGELARELGARVLELPGADHGLARLDQAQEVADAVAAFSAGLGGGGRA